MSDPRPCAATIPGGQSPTSCTVEPCPNLARGTRSLCDLHWIADWARRHATIEPGDFVSDGLERGIVLAPATVAGRWPGWRVQLATGAESWMADAHIQWITLGEAHSDRLRAEAYAALAAYNLITEAA